MRNRRFIAMHRDGLLTVEDHRRLMKWARECAMHVLHLTVKKEDPRLTAALEVARLWEEGMASTGRAMKASLEAHAAARGFTEPVDVAVSRSVGQAVATAHMADHSPGAALYALKAVKLAGRSVDEELEWQMKQLQHEVPGMKDLVREIMMQKQKTIKSI